jgi:hypothetical protein
MAVDQADEHAITEGIPPALASGLDKTARFIGPEIAAVLYFRLFARGAAL